MYVLVNIINWNLLLPQKYQKYRRIAKLPWHHNCGQKIFIWSVVVSRSRSWDQPWSQQWNQTCDQSWGHSWGRSYDWLKVKKVNLCVKILKHLVIFKNRQRRLGDGDGDAPFYWRGPRLNLIAPRSILPFWNRLGERIKKSLVMKVFTELPSISM